MVNLTRFLPLVFPFILLLSLFDNRVSLSGKGYKEVPNNFRVIYKGSYINPVKKILSSPEIRYSKLQGDAQIVLDKSSIKVASRGFTGFLKLKITVGHKSFIRTIENRESMVDSDSDGFPDYYELHSENDKDIFINLFTSIGRSQFYKISPNWESVHHDCAGLITFSYKEALKKHDLNWYKQFSIIDDGRSIERFNYPNIPYLGERCFNSNKGFIKTANASSLLNYNMVFISKNLDELEKGDVLFYYDEEFDMPYHSMIYLKDQGSVVYHTGPIDETNNGEVRLMLIDDLLSHPDTKWHPKLKNKYFLGGFRWRILI